MTITLIYLIILTSQQVHSKVITINTTGGSDSNKCCVMGECPCSSLSIALHNMTSNTVINIASESVTLHDNAMMGSGHLINILLTGYGATLMCNNSGSVQCEQCDNVIIEGITFDRCGHGNMFQGVKFNNGANISFINCTFQHSEVVVLWLANVHENVIIDHCNFLSDDGGLYVDCQPRHHINLTIHGSNFYQNGFLQHELSEFDGYGLKIGDQYLQSTESWSIIISQTNFSCNKIAASLFLNANRNISFLLNEVFVSNNTYSRKPFSLYFSSGIGDLFLLILNSAFTNNAGIVLTMSLFSHKNVTVLIANSSIGENFVSDDVFPSIVNIKSSKASNTIITLQNVRIANNNVYRIDNNPPILSGVLSINLTSITHINITMSNLNVTSNAFFYERGGAIQITTDSPSSITFSESMFFNNTSVYGAAFYIKELNVDCPYTVTITHCEFNHNIADESVGHISVPSDYKDLPSSIVHLVHSRFMNNIGHCMSL